MHAVNSYYRIHPDYKNSARPIPLGLGVEIHSQIRIDVFIFTQKTSQIWWHHIHD